MFRRPWHGYPERMPSQLDLPGSPAFPAPARLSPWLRWARALMQWALPAVLGCWYGFVALVGGHGFLTPLGPVTLALSVVAGPLAGRLLGSAPGTAFRLALWRVFVFGVAAFVFSWMLALLFVATFSM